MQPLAPGDPRTVGEFRLSARLGLGGMGQVFLGYSPAGRAVAVKICHPELAADPSFVERFAREATAAQAVNGWYTAQVVAAGPYDKPPWLATAYIPGPSLSDYVHGYGPLPEPAAWRLAAGLAEALLAVHACGLVHRDLKPSNVLLAVDGPRVIDFGIASALEGTSLTAAGSVMGSPPFMSPEQAVGAPVGPASDVFSLGSTLAFAASGTPPFGDGDAATLLFRVAHLEPALDSVPEGLRGVVAACLAKDPAARPTLPKLLRACQHGAAAGGNSAASFWPSQMTAAITRHQAGSMPAAPPDATLGDPIGRRRVLAGVGGLVVAGGLAAAGWEFAGRGSSTAAAKRAAGSSAGKRAAWVSKVNGPVRTGAAISVDGTAVYVGSDAGTVYELDAATGRQTGTFQVGGAVSGVTVAGDTLLVGSADGTVHAFAIGGSGVTWTSTAAGAAIVGVPTSGGNIVYAGSDDHYVYALDIATGNRKWRTKTGGATMPSQPGFDVVWVGSQDGTVYALDTGTGTVAAKVAVGSAVGAAPLAAEIDVYLGTSKGVLYDVGYNSLTTGTGKQTTSAAVQWDFPAGAAITGTPVAASQGQTVFAATTRGTVYSITPGSDLTGRPGTALWSYPVGSPVRSGLAVYSGVAYAGSDDGHLSAIDITTGTLSWKYPAGGAIRSSILAANELVYFGSLDGHVYALQV